MGNFLEILIQTLLGWLVVVRHHNEECVDAVSIEVLHILHGVDKRVCSGTHHKRQTVRMFAAALQQFDFFVVVKTRSFGSRAQRDQKVNAGFNLSFHGVGKSVVVDFVVFEGREQSSATTR